MMRYAIDIAPLGELADPVPIVRLGRAAEAAGWDGLSIWDSTGVSMGGAAADPFVTLSADAFGAMVEKVRAERAAVGRAAEPFDVAVFGFSDPGRADLVASYADRGATWWLESLSPMRGSLDELLVVVEAGPPRS